MKYSVGFILLLIINIQLTAQEVGAGYVLQLTDDFAYRYRNGLFVSYDHSIKKHRIGGKIDYSYAEGKPFGTSTYISDLIKFSIHFNINLLERKGYNLRLGPKGGFSYSLEQGMVTNFRPIAGLNTSITSPPISGGRFSAIFSLEGDYLFPFTFITDHYVALRKTYWVSEVNLGLRYKLNKD